MMTFKTMTGFTIVLLLLIITGFAVMHSGNESIDKVSADIEYDIEVEINGLHCSMCVKNSERMLKKLEQVDKVSVQLDEGLAYIKLKPDQTITKKQIIEAIEDAGFEAGKFKKFAGDEQTEQK